MPAPPKGTGFSHEWIDFDSFKYRALMEGDPAKLQSFFIFSYISRPNERRQIFPDISFA